MNEDLDNINHSLIHNSRYSELFREVEYNGKTLSDEERKELVAFIDEIVDQYKEGLPMMSDELERCKNLHDEYHELSRVLNSVMLFVLMTMIDNMVASKYFILADKEYDRRFMRGKLMVILNEGFKKMYGFDEKTHKKSEWDKLKPVLKYFPEQIHYQYQELTKLLEQHATTSTWWKEERNLETHLDAEKLYHSRQEEVIESKVMMDSMKLFNTLQAVNLFLTNMHGCLTNHLIEMYRRGELKEE